MRLGYGRIDRLKRAGYLGPEHGPFLCGNCVFFYPDEDVLERGMTFGQCDQPKVRSIVDYHGCCNLFEQDV